MSWTVEQMIQRAALEVLDGCCVALGGDVAPALLQRVGPDRQFWWLDGISLTSPCQGGDRVCFHSGAVQLTPMDGLLLVSSGRLDVLIVSAEQVSESGDLTLSTVTGADMDLLAGARRVVALMTHCRSDGSARILERCEYPIHGAGVVDRIITELGVIDVTSRGLLLVELAEGVSLGEISARTGVALILLLDDLPRSGIVATTAD